MRLFGLITLSFIAMSVIAITLVLWQNMKEPVVAKTNDGMSEGIKIHGDWEVKVTDPETGVEELYAFRNLFHDETGPAILVSVLGVGGKIRNTASEGAIWTYDKEQWQIVGAQGTTYCKAEGLNMGPNLSDLTGEDLNFFGNPMTLKLSGSCKVPSGMSKVGEVGTFASFISPNGQTIQRKFTTHSFGQSPIEVEPGQLISFNVSISFD
jgi:hypothetical protein